MEQVKDAVARTAEGAQRHDYDYVEMNKCFNEKHTTPFSGGKDMDEMKAMVRHANPKAVTDVATGWAGLSAKLTSIQQEFEKEVARIQEHWKGAAADGFAAKAKQVSKSIGDTAKYASHTSIAMTNAGSMLGKVKPEVLAMEKPGKVSSFLNAVGDGFTRSDDGTKKDIAAGMSAQEVVDRNHDDLSAGREAQLKMAVKMETLGASYNSQAKAMGSWNRKPPVEDEKDYPGDPGGITPTPVVIPSGSSPRSPQGVSSGTARRAQVGTVSPSKSVTPPSGITGGASKPTTPPAQNVGTAIDGISGGRTGSPTVGGEGVVSGGSASRSGGGGVGFGSGAAGAGVARGAMAGRPGMVGMAGRAGMGGMAGRAGAAAGAAEGGAARAGGSARASGGISGGTPRTGAGTGRGTAGGSGLHSSRGAVGRGANAVRKGGVVGTPGARTGRAEDEEQREGQRPDYLVEDEETWAPQRNVAPRVIEE